MVFVPSGHSNIKETLESKGSSKDSGDVNGVSLEQTGDESLRLVLWICLKSGCFGCGKASKAIRTLLWNLSSLETMGRPFVRDEEPFIPIEKGRTAIFQVYGAFLCGFIYGIMMK